MGKAGEAWGRLNAPQAAEFVEAGWAGSQAEPHPPLPGEGERPHHTGECSAVDHRERAVSFPSYILGY